MIYLFYFISNANPEIISGYPPRWYGLLFASGFLVGSYIMRWMYKLDSRDPKNVILFKYESFDGPNDPGEGIITKKAFSEAFRRLKNSSKST